jgi:hypothetical protein
MKTAITLTAVFLLTVVSFFSQSVNAQVVEKWVTKYNGTADGSDIGRSIVTDGAGNTYVTGLSDSMGTGDIITIKYNSAGTQVWAKKYNGPDNRHDEGIMIAIDASGNVYVTGISGTITAGSDIVTIKYDSDGTELWVARYDGPASTTETPSAITVDGSGNVFVAGSGVFSSPGTGYEFLTLKYSPSGGLAWARYYNLDRSPFFSGAEHATCLGTDGSGNVYVAGYSIAPSDTTRILLVGYGSGGDTLFASVYSGDGTGGREISSMAVTTGGTVYLCGYQYGGPGIGVGYLTLKNTGGTWVWAKTYFGPDGSTDEATKLVLDESENIYVTGFSSGEANDFATIKYNSAGDMLWVSRYNNDEDGDDRAVDIKVDASGNTYVTGWSRDTGTRYDYLTLKYSSSGTQLWEMRHHSTSATIDSKPAALDIDEAGNVYVTGFGNGATGNEDIITIRYEEVMTGVTGNTNSTPEGFELKQNYPNPFNPSTKISFSIPTAGMTTLKIYDMAGKEVAQLVNGNMNAGSHEFNFDAKGLSSGVYFYTLQSGDFVETKKMNLVK